jgi:hypothetical protein
VDDYVNSSYAFTGNSDFTISFWVKGGTEPGIIYPGIFPISIGTHSNITLGRMHPSSGYKFMIQSTDNNGLNFGNRIINIDIWDGNWYHIAFKRVDSTGQLFAYVNGVNVDWTGSFGSSTAPSITLNPSGDLYFGAPLGNTSYAWSGELDEVSVFDSALSSGVISAIYNNGTPTDLTSLNPVAWYRMGDNGLYKDPQWLIPSNENKDKVSNYSMDFDGTGNFVDLGDSDDFSFGNGTTDSPFSISAWIKIDSTSNFRIFNKYEGLINEYQFGMGVANNLQFYIFDSTSTFNYKARVYNTILNTGQWYHVAATYSGVGGTNAQDGMKIYVDGIRVDDSTVSGGSYVAMGNKTTPVYIGKLNTSYANGLIDEVSVYASELSQNDVTNIYNGGTPTTISGAISHWKLGEDSTFNGGVWTVPDSVGTNDGTSANMTIEDRVGTAPSSSNNSLSFNMDLIDRVPDTPPTP